MTYKKFISGMLVSIVCSGVALSSFAQEVYSPNVVGFQKLAGVSSSSGGLILGSAPFIRAVPNLDSVIGTNGVNNSSDAFADNVILFNRTNQQYTTYYLGSSRRWRTASAFATNVYLTPGMGYWYVNRSNANINLVLCGEVVDDLFITNTIVPGLQLISYPFNADIRVSEMTLTNGVNNASDAFADNLILFNNMDQRYTTYYLGSSRRWRTASAFATNVFIKSGQGFWYVSRASTNLSPGLNPDRTRFNGRSGLANFEINKEQAKGA